MAGNVSYYKIIQQERLARYEILRFPNTLQQWFEFKY
jgi:hypothetical protein